MVSSAFADLRRFIGEEMSLSHVYLRVMIKTLMENGGGASRTQIAKEILGRDPAQVAYYELVVRDMVGKVYAPTFIRLIT